MSKPYEGPVVISTFRLAGREVRLVAPGDPDRLLDDPDVLAWNRRDDYMPYWAYLWPGAVMLAEAVAREPMACGDPALEIGCGLGLAGLVGLARGLRVHFTDYDEAALEFVARSVRENGFDPAAFSTARLDWRDPPDDRFPLILAADVLYERRLVPMVADVLARMLEPGGLALIADPNRASAEGLPEALSRRGLTLVSIPVVAEVPGQGTTSGTIHRSDGRGRVPPVKRPRRFERSVPMTSERRATPASARSRVRSSSRRSEAVGS